MVLQKCPFVLPNSSVDVLSQEGMLLANNPVRWSSESRGMMTPFDGPCVTTCPQTQSAGVSGVTANCVESFPENFGQSEGTSILTILQQSPELGIPDLASRTNRGNQPQQAHKTQMIAKRTLWCFIDHHAFFFPDTLWRRCNGEIPLVWEQKHKTR